MKAIISGTLFLDSPLLRDWESRSVATEHGVTEIRLRDDVVFLQRHGSPALPPHRINHRANISALEQMGVKQIVSINSVGSLKEAHRPGTLLIPDDFVSPWDIPTFYDNEMRFFVPVMDQGSLEALHGICSDLRLPVTLGGTYIQTRGPRLETRAEIAMLRNYGDVVGMTMASEAPLCLERDIPYAGLCSIDNYCHGIVEVPLTLDEIRANVSRNLSTIESVLATLITRGLS